MGVRVSQVKPSNCFRSLEKLVLFSIFDKSLSSLTMWNLQSYPTTVLNEKCDILGGQKILWPLPHIFRGSVPPTHIIYVRPWLCCYLMTIEASPASIFCFALLQPAPDDRPTEMLFINADKSLFHAEVPTNDQHSASIVATLQSPPTTHRSYDLSKRRHNRNLVETGQ